jgi:hypothetical protein
MTGRTSREPTHAFDIHEIAAVLGLTPEAVAAMIATGEYAQPRRRRRSLSRRSRRALARRGGDR